jgi:MATE family multidrug resistance protein
MSGRREEARRLWNLAVPVIVTQVATMMLGVVDTLMVGHLSVEALAAAALGHLWTFGTLIFAMGAVIGMDPLITQAAGARDRQLLGLTLQRGVLLALLISLPISVLWGLTGPALVLLGQEKQLAAQAAIYTRVQIPTVAFFLVYTALRQYLQGRGIVRPALLVALAANVFNASFNWILIFGHLGVPAMGLRGAGLATGLSRVLMCGMLLWIITRWRLQRSAWVPLSRQCLELAGLRQLLVLGVPVGIQLSLEVWAFQICTLMAGRLGEVALAAHTIVLNLASLTFMVPLGIALAAVTRVGQRIGQGDSRGAQQSAWLAVGMGAGVMALSALAIVLTRHLLPLLYTRNAEVVELACSILPIAAAFQLFDGTQVTGGGVLRGMGSTLPAALINLLGYYALALPLAYWLGLHTDWGLAGIWWGLALGLAVVAITLVLWILRAGPARARSMVGSRLSSR